VQRILLITFASWVIAFTPAIAQSSEQSKAAIMNIADDYLTALNTKNPLAAYFLNFKSDRHDGIFDNSQAAISDWKIKEDGYLERLLFIDYISLKGTPEAILYAQLQEQLEASVGLRVCKKELWDIDFMGGGEGYDKIIRLAQFQPVGTKTLRKEALVRWTNIGAYFIQDIANLEQGLEQGYSAPKAVVNRVITQIDNLLKTSVDKSPLYSPITRDDDPEFRSAYIKVLKEHFIPAMRKYHQYLSDEYLPQAREELAIVTIPNGAKCYEAMFRGYTSLKWSAQKVHDIGVEAVRKNTEEVIKLGTEIYGLDDMGDILKRVNDDPKNRFETVEEMHAFFEAVLRRTVADSPDSFESMPKTQLDIKPYPDHLIGTGMSGSYEMGGDGRNAIFRYDPSTLKSTTKGKAEILSVHEGVPGHHMQIALVQDQPELHPVQRYFRNAAFIEGWARYAETLTEEMGDYETDFAKISRRAWPARGMVSDTGMHLLGWSEEDALKFNSESGQFIGPQGLDMIDRMASIPAQLTSYDSGALEIFALRQEAEDALGEKFDIKKFHTIILKNGIVPLWLLREQVEEWIADQR
jgi:uncharacterized protein (DUF885 family)